MGKGLLIVTLGAFMAISVLMLQTEETEVRTAEKQGGYQSEVMAREIARSAYNVAWGRARKAGNDLEQAMININGARPDGSPDPKGTMVGDYQGGSFNVQAKLINGKYLTITAEGIFADASHIIGDNYTADLLIVEDSSTVTVEFLDSMAGYCSAVFLERMVPEDEVDTSMMVCHKGKQTKVLNNPSALTAHLGHGDTPGFCPADLVEDLEVKYVRLEPEMIFDSGRWRAMSESRTSPADKVLAPGTLINFFIGVDKNCSEQGKWVDEYDGDKYDWEHRALREDTDLGEVVEGKFAMVEQHAINTQRWRIGFEDLRHFSDAQHEDIKANSYGGSWDGTSYNGTGWTLDSEGYKELRNFGGKPDFSDQVIEVTLTSCSGSCPTPPAS